MISKDILNLSLGNHVEALNSAEIKLSYTSIRNGLKSVCVS